MILETWFTRALLTVISQFFLYNLTDVLRFGGSAQSHLIYHPNSFFPRSAMVNLTVDVLGASINVLEAAARFEGFEILIEQMFGEDGYYPDDRIMKMFNLKPHEERDNEEKSVNYKRLRGKRSIQDDINKVENHLNRLHRTVSPEKTLLALGNTGEIKRLSMLFNTSVKRLRSNNYHNMVI